MALAAEDDVAFAADVNIDAEEVALAAMKASAAEEVALAADEVALAAVAFAGNVTLTDEELTLITVPLAKVTFTSALKPIFLPLFPET